MVNHLLKRLRSPVLFLVELLLPIVFVCAFVIIWATIGTPSLPGRQYVNYSSPDNVLSSATLRSLLCIDNGTFSIIPRCPTGAVLDCGPFRQYVPEGIQRYSLCTIGIPTAALLSSFLSSTSAAMVTIPSLDDMILLQWVARRFPRPRGQLGATPQSSLALSGLVYVSPLTASAQRLVDYLNSTSSLFQYVYGGLYDSASTVDNIVTGLASEGRNWAAINVDAIDSRGMSVTISVNRSAISDTTLIVANNYGGGQFPSGAELYITSGFSTLQMAVNNFYQATYGGLTVVTPSPTVVSMGYIPYRDSSFYDSASQFASLAIVLGMLFPVAQMVKSLVLEKELRVREAMMIMGLTNAPYFAAWFVFHALIYLVEAAVVTIILATTFITRSNGGIVFFLFLFFFINSIALSGLFASFFSRSRTSAIISPLLYFGMAIPLFVIQSASARVLRGTLLLGPTAFAQGLSQILSFEAGLGLQASDLRSSSVSVTMLAILVALIGVSVLYFVLMLYFDAVVPTDWGVPRHPLFFIIDPINACRNRPALESPPDGRDPNGVFETTSSTPVVRLKGLRKTFERGKETLVAVDNLYWDLCEGDVSVLLGHNGAGKTTTINLMTGMLPIDGGDCSVYGRSVVHELKKVRQVIGFCPQHNILWPELTCAEHLRFYARIKGVPSDDIEASIDEMLLAVDLEEKRNERSERLSGGQKRKLSVAIAFMGGSKLVFLDEPTAGMDVAARRFTWGLIKRMSAGRATLLTTHFMDEADLLGNVIAIMSKGRLKCSGSSLFLKSRLGVGYTLTVSLTPGALGRSVMESITHRCEAEMVSMSPGELTLRIDLRHVTQLPMLLEWLESGSDDAIRNFAVSVTTLEEIFLRIAQDAEESHGDAATSNAVEEMERKDAQEPAALVWTATAAKSQGGVLFRQQLRAMLRKRLLNSIRDIRTQFLQVLLPIIAVLLAMALTLINFVSTSSVDLSPSVYGGTVEVPVANCGGTSFSTAIPLSPVVTTVVVAAANAFEMSNYLVDTFRSHGRRYSAIVCQDANVSARRMGLPSPVLFANYSSYHSIGIATQTLAQWHLNSAYGNTSVVASISNKPLPNTGRQQALFSGIRAVLIAVVIMIPFSFIPSTFVGWLVKERQCKSRHLQEVSGVNYFAFWIANYIFDVASFFISIAAVMIIFVIFQRDEYIGDSLTGGATVVSLLLYALSSVPNAYLSSLFFNDFTTAQNVVMFGYFICVILVLVVATLNAFPTTSVAGEVLTWILRLFPPFSISEAFVNLATRYLLLAFGIPGSPFALTTVGYPLIFMGAGAIVYSVATLIVDHPYWGKRGQVLFYNREGGLVPSQPEDTDVAQERLEVESGQRDSDLVLMNRLGKDYGSNVAVESLSLGIHKGEVFGFLGTNGAGKTTTIAMLCQEFLPTRGTATIVGYDVVNDSKAALQCVGYCPQFDALLDLLSVEEHLELFAAIRGVSPDAIEATVEALISICELTEHRATLATNLSGGNKRKLSVALALIGGPRVVMLDEPSAGMDPVARRGLWKAIKAISDNCSVILTTHHLEEVEALAQRVAIMVRGSLRCIGDKTHLKHKYGSGFELLMRMKDDESLQRVKSRVTESLPMAALREEQGLRITYTLPPVIRLSAVFRLLLAEGHDWGVEDFAVAQASIEQVFLRIRALAENSADHGPSTP